MGEKSKKHSTYHGSMKGGEKGVFFHLKIIKLIVMIYTQKNQQKRSWFLTIGKCDKKGGESWKMMEIKN